MFPIMTTPRSRRAFTLVELLVVLGVITVLIGLLLPTLSKARRYSQMVRCAAQLKNIGAGWIMYVSKENRALPPAVNLPAPRGTAPDELTIMKVMEKQVPSANVWQCPSDDRGYFEQRACSYEYLPALTIARDPENAVTLATYSRAHPQDVPILADAEVFHPTPAEPIQRQCLYYDGHVEWLKLPEGISP